MDEARRELVQVWLLKAKTDLAVARKTASGPDSYLDAAIYHCQQNAEKAIKAFLVFHDQPFEKIHDLAKLIRLAMPFEPKFSELLPLGDVLTPYVSEFRYPDERILPSQEEFESALAAAERVYHFVLSLLPKEVHP